MPLAWGAFLLIGWTGVMLPSLVRQVEGRFAVDDAAFGIAFLAGALAYATSSFAGGYLTERIGRRVVLGVAALVIVSGLVLEGTATTWWPAFWAGNVLVGLGSGSIDGGMNGLVLALTTGGRGRALNLLHLFFSIGALLSPLLIGQLVSGGLEWQQVIVGTAGAALAIMVAIWIVPMPTGLRHPGTAAAAAKSSRGDVGRRRIGRRPLALLGVAIACYVAAEVGVSNWLVRFLDRADLDTATFALSVFWAGLALGRVVASRIADRISHARLTAVASMVAGIAIVVAVASPSIELSIAAFAVTGFAFGPVFPMIIAIGGDLYPDRVATTAGTLTAVAILGATFYPPLVGLMSASVGIGAGILGAGALSIVCAAAVMMAARQSAVRA